MGPAEEVIAHAVGARVSGSGITLTATLGREHLSGVQVMASVPTPGAPNRYQFSVRSGPVNR